MSFSIEKKFVVGISSSALFNLEKEDQIFENLGLKAYKDYQIKNRKEIIEKGTAFPFIKRFLNIKEALQNCLFGQYFRCRNFKILTYDQYAPVLKFLRPQS